MSAAAAACCAGATFSVTTPAQPGWTATRRQASWTISACLAMSAGGASPSASTVSAAVIWPARRAGPPATTGTAPAGATPTGEGRARDGRWMVDPALAGLGPGALRPPPGAEHPATGQLTTAQTAASRGSLRSRDSGKPGTAVDLSPTGCICAGGAPRDRPARRVRDDGGADHRGEREDLRGPPGGGRRRRRRPLRDGRGKRGLREALAAEKSAGVDALAAEAARALGCENGLETAEAVLRAGLLRLGGAMLGQALSADPGHRGPPGGLRARPRAGSTRASPGRCCLHHVPWSRRPVRRSHVARCGRFGQ